MRRSPTVRGAVVQFNEARWATLEAALGSDIAAWFMWMHEIRLDDGTRIDAYKHTTTRRYLHLSDDGRAFDNLGDDGYGEVDLATAIVRGFSGWERALPPPPHLQAMREAVAAARRHPAS